MYSRLCHYVDLLCDCSVGVVVVAGIVCVCGLFLKIRNRQTQFNYLLHFVESMDLIQKHHSLFAEHFLIIACNLDGVLHFVDSTHGSRQRNKLGITTRTTIVGNDPGQCGLHKIS